jgi:uncharacterized iron-regulated protein
MMTRLFYLLLLTLPMAAFSQDSLMNHCKIYSTTRQRIVTTDEIAGDMQNADVLFFGEEHSDSTGHYLEQVLFKKLADKYPGKIALSMEMFETDCQYILDEYLSGFLLEKNLVSDARAWSNYKDYRPLVELAKANKIPVIAANAPHRYVSLVNRSGLSVLDELDKTGKSFLPPLPIDTATGLYYDKFLQIMGGHAMPGMQMYQAQNLWDATMAWSIAHFAKSHKGYKIFQVNGSFHSEEKLGAAAQLKKYDKKLHLLNIATFCDDNYDNPDWNKLSKFGDYIILTDPKLPKTF